MHLLLVIFQEYIAKQFEIRLTCIGDHYFAAKIDSQAVEVSKMDWRANTRKLGRLEVVKLPLAVQEKCRSVMQALGLVFGCMDLIVTPSGDYVFLEVNEMGQFLWVEQLCPRLPLLEAFSRMLSYGRADFSMPALEACTLFEEYANSEQYQIDNGVRFEGHAVAEDDYVIQE